MINLRRLDHRITEDTTQTFIWRNDQSIWKWCRQYEPLSFTEHLRWFEFQDTDPSVSMFAIELDEDNSDQEHLVGVCGLTSIDRQNRRAEFSLYIGPEWQRFGYGAAALAALFDHGFKGMGLHHIYGESFAGNPAVGMFEKLGMRCDGVRREAYFRGGKFVDAALFSILSFEWKS